MSHYLLNHLPHHQTDQSLLVQGPRFYRYSYLRLDLRSSPEHLFTSFRMGGAQSVTTLTKTTRTHSSMVASALPVAFTWLPICTLISNVWRIFPLTTGAIWFPLTVHTIISTRRIPSSSGSQKQNVICSISKTSSPYCRASTVLHRFSKLSCRLACALSALNLHRISSSLSHHDI